MKTKKMLLKIDMVVQLVLLILLGVFGVFMFLTKDETVVFFGLTLFCLGAWQFVSGFLFGIIKSDSKRVEYVFGSACYIAFLIIGCFIVSDFDFPEFLNMVLLFMFFGVVPSLIGLWYFRYTQEDLEKVKKELQDEASIKMQDILDSDELFKT